MNDVKPLDRQTAEMYAAWFKALADGTRVQIGSLLARAGRPLTVRDSVAAGPVGQSTVDEPSAPIVLKPPAAGTSWCLLLNVAINGNPATYSTPFVSFSGYTVSGSLPAVRLTTGISAL